MEKVNLAEKLSQFNDYFNPRIAGELNGQQACQPWLVKLVKFQGEFIIMPKGIEHKPVAEEEVEIMLFEPATTLNTGNVENEMTRKKLKHL